MNLNIPGKAFLLDSRSARLESQLSKACIDAENKRKFLNKKGTVKQRQEFLEKWKTLVVLEKDIVSVEDWKSQINTLEQKLEVAGANIEEWKQKYGDIEKEKQDLFQEMVKEKELMTS